MLERHSHMHSENSYLMIANHGLGSLPDWSEVTDDLLIQCVYAGEDGFSGREFYTIFTA